MNRRRFATLAVGGMAMGLVACGRRSIPSVPALGTLASNNARVAWRKRLGEAGAGFRPSLSGDSLWVADRAARVLRVGVADGVEQVRVELDTPLVTGVGSDRETQWVVDAEGGLVALDADGARRWRTELGAKADSIPAAGSGTVVVRLSNNTVVGFDSADGSQRWVHARRGPPLVLRQTSAVALDSTAAYVGLPGGRVVALSLTTGATLWEAGITVPRGSNEIERIADVVGTPALAGDELCALAFQGRLTCVDRDSGRLVWTADLLGGGGVAVDGRIIAVADSEDRLRGYSRSHLDIWTQEALRGRRLGQPLLAQGLLWVGDANGFVHVLDAATGSILGRTETDGTPIVSPPVALPGDSPRVAVQTRGGMLAAIDARAP